MSSQSEDDDSDTCEQQISSNKTEVTAADSNINNKKLSTKFDNQIQESDSNAESSEESERASSHHSEEVNAFKRKEAPQGVEEMKTKLMRRLEQGEGDSDDCDNSFGDINSEGEDDDEEEEEDESLDSPDIMKDQQHAEEPEDDEDEEEDDEESPARKPKKKVLQPKKTIFDILKEPEKPKKFRKNVMNVFCTEYEVVKRVARRQLGYRLKEFDEDHEGAVVNGEGNQKLSQDWDVSWHDLGITADFLSKMQPYQKVNQYPGMYVITRKNYLARNLMKMQRAFPDEYKFFPKTWLIPQESTDFRRQFIDEKGKPNSKKRTFIVKPEGLSQGQGIYLSRNCEQIIENCTVEGGFIVQDYLDKPHLIDDLKYDLRIYVLLYGINPMRVYIHEQGLARFATEPYTHPKASNLDNMFMHLTNYAINKNNGAFKQNAGCRRNDSEEESAEEESGDEESGHKRSLNAILKILYEQGADADRVMDEIKDIIVKTLIVGQPYMSHIYRSCQPDDYDNSMCFQILGFDIMIDKYFKPWLIEVNQSPSFATDSPLDYEVKKQVLRDSFRLLNVNQERREKFIRLKQRQMAERILTGKQDKVDPQVKKQLKEERLAERFVFENAQMRCGSSNKFEIIFPRLYEEEKNQQYEVFIKKANDIWDEFTTGAKGKKKAAEQAAEKEKAEQAAQKAQQQKKIQELKQKEMKLALEKKKEQQKTTIEKLTEGVQLKIFNKSNIETKIQPVYKLAQDSTQSHAPMLVKGKNPSDMNADEPSRKKVIQSMSGFNVNQAKPQLSFRNNETPVVDWAAKTASDGFRADMTTSEKKQRVVVIRAKNNSLASQQNQINKQIITANQQYANCIPKKQSQQNLGELSPDVLKRNSRLKEKPYQDPNDQIVKSFDAAKKQREQAIFQHRLSTHNNNQKADNLFKATENGLFSSISNQGANTSAPTSIVRPLQQKATRIIQVNQSGVFDCQQQEITRNGFQRPGPTQLQQNQRANEISVPHSSGFQSNKLQPNMMYPKQQQFVHKTPQQAVSRKFPGLMSQAHKSVNGSSGGPYMQQTIIPQRATNNFYANNGAGFSNQYNGPKNQFGDYNKQQILHQQRSKGKFESKIAQQFNNLQTPKVQQSNLRQDNLFYQNPAVHEKRSETPLYIHIQRTAARMQNPKQFVGQQQQQQKRILK